MSNPPSPSASFRMRRSSLPQHRSSQRRLSRSPSLIIDEPPAMSCPVGGSSTLLSIINFILLAASLILIGTGAGLMGFYRIHMLDVITVEFLIVPLILVVGGVFTLFTAIFGFYITFRNDSCLMVTYAVFLALEFIILMAGIISSVRLLFDIQTGLFDADVITELTLYETDPWVKYKWDTLQREFSCCGGYGYTLGYQDWKHTIMGGARNSVPDSCCLTETPQCGKDVFVITDLRKVIGKIHTHGCLTIMLVRLESHVNIILLVFSVVGGILAIIELLGVVLACCIAQQIANSEGDNWDYDYGDPYGGEASHPPPRPTSPQTMMSQDLSSHHETAF